MWILTKKNDCSLQYALNAEKEYIVGRNNADIIMIDKSISRNHAKLMVDSVSHCLTVKDISRFGTFVNKERISKCGSVNVPSGSELTFGFQPGITVIAKRHTMFSLLSSVTPLLKGELQLQLQAIGFNVLHEWAPSCNLLVMSKLIVTHKVLHALLSAVPIVHPGYISALLEACKTNPFVEPNKNHFLPPIEEKAFTEADANLFLVKTNRCDVFNGKTFLLNQSQLQRYQLLLNMTNARVELLQCTKDSDIHVASLFHKIQPESCCLLYESLAFTNQYHQSVYKLCQEFGIRPILEQEISFAIIYNSCDVFCNARAHCDDRILRQLRIPQDNKLELTSKYQYSNTNRVTQRISLLKRGREESDTSQPSVNENGKRTCLRNRKISTLVPTSLKSPVIEKDANDNLLVLCPETTNTSTVLLKDSVIENDTKISSLCSNSPDLKVKIASQMSEPSIRQMKILEGGFSSSPLRASRKAFLAGDLCGHSTKLQSPNIMPVSCGLDAGIFRAFDSLPSLSSMRRNKPGAVPLLTDPVLTDEPETSNIFESRVQVGKENFPPSTTNYTRPSERLEASDSVIKLGSSVLLPSTASVALPQQKISLSEEMFISKETLRQLKQSSLDLPKPNATIHMANLCVGTAKNSAIISTTPPASFFAPKTANFKCFRKVWPFHKLRQANPDFYNENTAHKWINLVTFLPGTKMNVTEGTRFNDSTSIYSEDAAAVAKIDKLFNELCALPSVRRR